MENTQVLNSEKVKVFNDLTKLSLKEVYHNNYRNLYYYGLKLSGSEEIAKDCIQDLFLQFWSNCEQLSDVRSIKAYLFKCLRRRIFFTLGKEKKINNLTDIENLDDHSMKSVEDEIIKTESDNILEQKLINARKELTSRQQEVIYLKYHLGYSYDTICEIMDIKYQSVRNLQSEAVRLLRDKLDTDHKLS